MKIIYLKGVSVNIQFSKEELHSALAILKAMAVYFKASWIFDVASNLQDDLFPKPRLTHTNYHHICEKCFCEVDSRTDNALHYTGDKERWNHKTCPVLKDNRPA